MRVNKQSAIEKIDFHGDVLEAVRQPNTNQTWVVLKRVCEALGVDALGQQQRLKKKAWAVTCMTHATGSDGKTYEMLCINLDSLPMWLATIETRRVAKSVRPKLELYQRECAKVLRDHWLQDQPSERFNGIEEELLGAAMHGEMLEFVTMSVHTAMTALLEKFPAMIAHAVDTALASRNGTVNGCIGKEAAKAHITSRMRAMARMFVGASASTKEVNRWYRQIEGDVREKSGVATTKWEYLPTPKLETVMQVVSEIEVAAVEVARERSEELRKQREMSILKKWADDSN